jgi:hypothetical protein
VDERGRGKTGMGRWPVFILKEIGSVARPRKGKGAVWARPHGGGKRKREGGPGMAAGGYRRRQLMHAAEMGCRTGEGDGPRATRRGCD